MTYIQGQPCFTAHAVKQVWHKCVFQKTIERHTVNQLKLFEHPTTQQGFLTVEQKSKLFVLVLLPQKWTVKIFLLCKCTLNFV